ncbi:glutamate 5-kinase [Haliangium ochraceum DSM 14365]|uniref:Glutamate 5-kinase n=2 Tax=Haliangium ochraceum TaxID=80816 RepID=D0LK37_HALO1|nr:glutamate 5-kinase [Haliangium ochraceum DSM 14365]
MDTPTPPASAADAALSEDLSTRREVLGRARRVVVKVGSRLLAESPAARPALLADDIARQRRGGERSFLVVSSGAVALGSRVLGFTERPRALPVLQAAAAVGQGKLLQHWEHAFAAHDVNIAQLLLTHDDIADRSRFLNARHTLQALLEAGVVPVINENDSVAVEEIKYGDNDLLAALVSNLVGADALLILTDVEGLRGADGVRMSLVRDIEREAVPVAKPPRADGVGSGGMASKVQAARAAARSGVVTVVAPGRHPNVIDAVLGGDDVGTVFLPEAARMSSRKHWLAYGGKPVGRILVDEGARRALVEGGRSLLPAGIIGVEGSFGLGDLVSLATAESGDFARGLVGYRSDDVSQLMGRQSSDIESTLGYKYLDAVMHRDDLVLL